MEKVKKKESLSLFDIVGNINLGSTGPDLLNSVSANPEHSLPNSDSPEKAYVPFMINRSLSYFQDTVLLANEMNRYASLPVKMQYDFLRNTIRPRKRFSKWFKALPDDADIRVIKEHYGYSSEKARDVLPLFDAKALSELHELYDKGGKA